MLGLDFRGHGDSDDGPTTFGLLEIEDVAGALAWLGERGITRVALFGTSMGGITAIAAVAVLGDGTLAAADGDPTAPRDVDSRRARRSSASSPIRPRRSSRSRSRPGCAVRPAASWRPRLFDGATRVLGADPRATEPIRVVGLARARAAPAHPRRRRHDGADRGRSAAGRARGPVRRALGRPGRRPQRAATRSRPRTTSGGSRTSCALRSAAGAATMSVRRGPAL